MASNLTTLTDAFVDNVDDVDDVLAADLNTAYDALRTLTAVLSPASIGADQNNYNPTNFAGTTMLRLTASAAYNITGLAGGERARIVIIHNVGSFTITLKDENASSSAANRFTLTADIALASDATLILQYDSTSSRWRAATLPGVTNGDTHDHVGGDGAAIVGIVTNGDTHDHAGGDGAQVNHTGLSNIGTNTHAQIDAFLETHSFVGLFTRDVSTASGTQAITGVGFQPSAVIFFASVDGSAVASWGLAKNITRHIATYNGPTVYTLSTQCIGIYISAGNFNQGDVTTWGADGFTITWTKGGSPTGVATVNFMAFR